MDIEEKKEMEETEVSEAFEGEIVEEKEIPLSTVQDWVARHKEREATRDEIRQRVRGSVSKSEYFRPAKPKPTIKDMMKSKLRSIPLRQDSILM